MVKTIVSCRFSLKPIQWQWFLPLRCLQFRKMTGRSNFNRITVQQYEGESTNKCDMTKLPCHGEVWSWKNVGYCKWDVLVRFALRRTYSVCLWVFECFEWEFDITYMVYIPGFCFLPPVWRRTWASLRRVDEFITIFWNGCRLVCSPLESLNGTLRKISTWCPQSFSKLVNPTNSISSNT